jgi:hypothetical protein
MGGRGRELRGEKKKDGGRSGFGILDLCSLENLVSFSGEKEAEQRRKEPANN